MVHEGDGSKAVAPPSRMQRHIQHGTRYATYCFLPNQRTQTPTPPPVQSFMLWECSSLTHVHLSLDITEYSLHATPRRVVFHPSQNHFSVNSKRRLRFSNAHAFITAFDCCIFHPREQTHCNSQLPLARVIISNSFFRVIKCDQSQHSWI